VSVKVKYVKAYRNRHGKEYIYFRRGAVKIPLRGPLGSPEFWEDYHAACGKEIVSKPAAQIPTHSWAWAVKQYLKSAEFKQLGSKTQIARQNVLERWVERNDGKVGASAVRSWKGKHFRKVRDDMVDTPHAWNNLRKFLNQVYTVIIGLEVVETNPLRDVKKLASNNKDGHHTWTIDEIHQYQDKHPIGTNARLALELALMTSLRISDVCQIGRQHITKDGNWIDFRQTKGDVQHKVPLLRQLRNVIDQTDTEGLLTFLVTSHGKPYTVNGLGNAVRKWCDQAGLPHCSMHGLRKAMLCYLAEPPMLCTTQEIMSISNHQNMQDVETYVAKVRKERLAEGVRQRLEDQNEDQS
tara:strand:+ start:427 stop:1485 length:1059 start_codon:yes stop_codon:yes gene_type:complete